MKEESSWIKYIKQRIEKNKNFLCIISGSTGSGKSWSGLSIAEQLDPDFNVNRCVFRGIEFLNLINHGNLPSGSVILFDEVQIDMNVRNWQSIMNKMLNYLISTFRHKNLILIFTSPYIDFIDSATMKLFHANFETVGINRKENVCILKPKLLQYNQNLKKWYRKYLKVQKTGIGTIKIKKWLIPKPSKRLIEHYEYRKKEFTSDLNKDILDKLLQAKKKEKKQSQ